MTVVKFFIALLITVIIALIAAFSSAIIADRKRQKQGYPLTRKRVKKLRRSGSV